MTFRRTFVASAIAAIALCSTLGAQAQTMVLKASDTHPAGYPTVVAVENMGKKLEAATNGRIKMQMFPGAVLGQEKETVEQAQIGAIQIVRISSGRGRPCGARRGRVQHAFCVPRHRAHARCH